MRKALGNTVTGFYKPSSVSICISKNDNQDNLWSKNDSSQSDEVVLIRKIYGSFLLGITVEFFTQTKIDTPKIWINVNIPSNDTISIPNFDDKNLSLNIPTSGSVVSSGSDTSECAILIDQMIIYRGKIGESSLKFFQAAPLPLLAAGSKSGGLGNVENGAGWESIPEYSECTIVEAKVILWDNTKRTPISYGYIHTYQHGNTSKENWKKLFRKFVKEILKNSSIKTI